MSLVFTVVENQERNNGKMEKEIHKLGGASLSVLEPERKEPPTHSFLGGSRISSTEKKENTISNSLVSFRHPGMNSNILTAYALPHRIRLSYGKSPPLMRHATRR